METDRLVRKAGKTFTTWRPWLSIKASANLAGLLALPCRIDEFSCVPPHNEEEKTVDPDELSTTNTKLLNNYFWQDGHIHIQTLGNKWYSNSCLSPHTHQAWFMVDLQQGPCALPNANPAPPESRPLTRPPTSLPSSDQDGFGTGTIVDQLWNIPGPQQWLRSSRKDKNEYH